MTTAAPAAKATAAKATAAPASKLLHDGLVDIAKIAVGVQARKKFDKDAIKELADSIRDHSLIHPVTLRPDTKPGQWVLVSGERRLRAVQSLGLTTIDARAYDIDAATAALWQIDENLHRQDLTPLEEARGFRALMDAGKRTAEELGSIVKKNVGYVTRAVKLLELPRAMLADLEDGKITPAHGHQLLRVLPVERESVYADWLANYGGNGNARSMREHVEQTVGRSLESATFPLNKPYAGEQACSGCPSNSGNQGDMFGGATKGRCLGPKGCFQKKVVQATEDRMAELKKSYPAAQGVQRVSSHVYNGTKVDFGDQRGWVIRELFNKRIPKGKFALVLCGPTDEVWIATPLTGEEQKRATRVDTPVQPTATPEQAKAQQEREDKRDAAITAAVLKATTKQITAAFAVRLKQGYEAEVLKQAKVKPTDTLRALWVVGVRNGDWADDELVKLLGVKLPK